MYYRGGTMAIELTVKRLGNSLGVIFPKELVKSKSLKPNQKILMEVVKEADLSEVFGSLKTNVSGQTFKNMVRKGWK